MCNSQEKLNSLGQRLFVSPPVSFMRWEGLRDVHVLLTWFSLYLEISNAGVSLSLCCFYIIHHFPFQDKTWGDSVVFHLVLCVFSPRCGSFPTVGSASPWPCCRSGCRETSRWIQAVYSFVPDDVIRATNIQTAVCIVTTRPFPTRGWWSAKIAHAGGLVFSGSQTALLLSRHSPG